MQFFDFHHHKKDTSYGIYNLNFGETPPNHPYSIGIHPQDIQFKEIKKQLQWVEEHITPNCFAIGECGLDKLVRTNFKVQQDVLQLQIDISNEFKKPVIIHCVRAFYELIPFQKKAKQPIVIHGFNKKQSIADDLLKNNFYLSFGKAVLYNLSLQNTLETTPLEKMFLETDNDDFIIGELYQKVAQIKKISVNELQQQILENLETIKNG